MASADFSWIILSPLNDNTSLGTQEFSPGNTLLLSYLYPPYLLAYFTGKFRTLQLIACLSNKPAYYTVAVRRVSTLPAASFRFYLTIDTLAVKLMIPLTGLIRDLHPIVKRPAGRTKKKKPH